MHALKNKLGLKFRDLPVHPKSRIGDLLANKSFLLANKSFLLANKSFLLANKSFLLANKSLTSRLVRLNFCLTLGWRDVFTYSNNEQTNNETKNSTCTTAPLIDRSN
jgi:hypothetical protein